MLEMLPLLSDAFDRFGNFVAISKLFLAMEVDNDFLRAGSRELRIIDLVLSNGFSLEIFEDLSNTFLVSTAILKDVVSVSKSAFVKGVSLL